MTKPILISVTALLAVVILIVFTSWMLYSRTVDTLTQNLKERFLSISIIEAANIDSKDLDALQTESDWQKPEWSRVVNQLHKAKYSSSDIVFMYIFRKTKDDPTQMEFIADADSIDPYANTSGDPSRYVDVNRDGQVEPDGPDKLQWPGQPYPEAVDIPEAYEAYNGPLTVKDLYTDEYGTVLTGYAPITDENGNVVAILATDIKADDFFTITRQTLQPFLIFIGALSLIISILILVIIYFWRKNAEELGALTKKLESANERLKELDHMKSEFLSFASHQIKAPLAAIKGFATLIYDGTYGQTSEKVNEAAHKIKDSSDRMVQLVGDFLNVRKIEEGKMVYKFERVDVVKIIRSICEELKLLAQNKKLDFTLDSLSEGGWINADPQNIRQVFQNLIENAIKYTDSGFVKVRTESIGSKFIFSVSDSGHGISKELLPHLFEEFRRDALTTGKIEGTGLGLFIAHQITIDHGGEIWIESDGLGKGSKFLVKLPLA